LRADSAGLDLADKQAQWVVGRNPFAQSTMYGEGYDWAQQYSVSSSDFVGSLPVGMQSRGLTDLPYWPSQNMYVYKEVWVHSNIRWLWLMEDLLPDRRVDGSAARLPKSNFAVTSSTAANGEVTIRVTASGTGVHSYALRTDNFQATSKQLVQTSALRDGVASTLEWRGRLVDAKAPLVAVVIEDADMSRRRDVYVP
jgi:hypothetical protein